MNSPLHLNSNAMSDEVTNVFITGAGRGKQCIPSVLAISVLGCCVLMINPGLGRALVESYLSRPNHTVIGSVRNESSPNTTSLKAFKPAAGSRLIVVKISNESKTDTADAVEAIKSAGVSSLDVVIANSGIAGKFSRLESVAIEDFEELFQVNTFPVMRLYLAVYPLLKAASEKQPKFIAISSLVGSITNLQDFVPIMAGSYGASKAAVNFLVRWAHAENEWLTAFLLHPGWVP